jgi:hypothetical protein
MTEFSLVDALGIAILIRIALWGIFSPLCGRGEEEQTFAHFPTQYPARVLASCVQFFDPDLPKMGQLTSSSTLKRPGLCDLSSGRR